MKKFLLSALAALVLAPVSTFADGWTKTVKDVNEFKAAVKSIGVGAPGETYEIICDWEPGVTVSAGKLGTPYMIYGRVVIRSNQTDFEKMPEVTFSMEQGWKNGDNVLSTQPDGRGLSLIFENLKINAGGRSYFIDAQKTDSASIDTLAFRHCDLSGSKRSWVRWDGPANENCKKSVLKNLEFTECICHNMNISAGDNWSMTRVFTPVKNMTWKDCIFYDMQYTKSLWEGRYPGDEPANVTFANNLVLLAQNKAVATTGFTVLMPGANLATGTMVEIANNIFVGPQAGIHTMANYVTDVSVKTKDENGNDTTIVVKDSLTNYNNTEITNVQSAIVYFDNNVVDEASYKSIEQETAKLEGYANPSTVIAGTNYVLGDGVHQIDWTTGATFQDPAKDVYFMLKSNPWYTDGLGLDVETFAPTYIGPSVAYIDAFPTPAAINVTIDGPVFCSYKVVPEKTQYYVGDEVSVVVADKNNYYRNFTTFEGWTGAPAGVDATAKEFKTVLAGDLNLTAKFTTNVNPIAAFPISADPKDVDLKAEIYYNMDEAYQAIAQFWHLDSAQVDGKVLGEPTKHVYRASKFGDDEEEPELHQSVVRASTIAYAKQNGMRDMIVVKANTKGFKNIKASAICGTDNNASKKLLCKYSLDGVNFTECGGGELEAGLKWAENAGVLPAECDDQELVYVAFMEDPSAVALEDYVINPAAFIDEVSGSVLEGEALLAKINNDATMFYVGNILISGDAASAINGVNADAKGVKSQYIYNLAGQKVSKDFRGIVIMNGKKVVK